MLEFSELNLISEDSIIYLTVFVSDLPSMTYFIFPSSLLISTKLNYWTSMWLLHLPNDALWEITNDIPYHFTSVVSRTRYWALRSIDYTVTANPSTGSDAMA